MLSRMKAAMEAKKAARARTIISHTPYIFFGLMLSAAGLIGFAVIQPNHSWLSLIVLSIAAAATLAFCVAIALAVNDVRTNNEKIARISAELHEIVEEEHFNRRIGARSGGPLDVLVDEIDSVLEKIEAKQAHLGEMADIINQREQENQLLWLEIEHNLCLAKEEAERDGLTNLYNRKTAETRLDEETEKALALNKPLSVLMADLDHFKRVNDVFGHQVGDEVLMIFADTLRETTRLDDVAARYGGEEFIITLPGTPVKFAVSVATRINQEFARSVRERLAHIEGLACTVSIGVADMPTCASDKTTLVAAADTALFKAKELGRNRVVYFGDLEGGSKETPDTKIA